MVSLVARCGGHGGQGCGFYPGGCERMGIRYAGEYRMDKYDWDRSGLSEKRYRTAFNTGDAELYKKIGVDTVYWYIGGTGPFFKVLMPWDLKEAT